MELPALKIPAYELPFDVPTMLHAPVDHFVIAIPVIVLLLEVINLITKKRAIGVTAFFLLLLTMIAAMAAYITGTIDGKEAYPLLSEMAQSELKEHKILGTYLMLMSVVVLFVKLLSILIKKGLMKGFYILVLTLFVVGILKQGHEGGELVYEYGVNVEKVQDQESTIDDLKEEVESLEDEAKILKLELENQKNALKAEVDKKLEISKSTVETSQKQEQKVQGIILPEPTETATDNELNNSI
jgi:uncharacterized membrane protein